MRDVGPWDRRVLVSSLNFNESEITMFLKIAFVSLLGFSIMSACSYTQPPGTVEPGSEVGGTGGVKYTYEPLGNNKHLLTVTAAPGLMETESSIAQRIHIFANKFAARTCPSAFEFIHDPNFDQSIAGGFMKRTKTYVFTCSG